MNGAFSPVARIFFQVHKNFVDEDSTENQVESYLWKDFVDFSNFNHFSIGKTKRGTDSPRTICVRSVTDLLLGGQLRSLLSIFWDVNLGGFWAKKQLEY
jgi:hypothetical protein